MNGLKYDLLIEVALSTTCMRDSELCTSVECPIDEKTRSEWMVSVVTPPAQPIGYNILNVTRVDNVVGDSVRILLPI